MASIDIPRAWPPTRREGERQGPDDFLALLRRSRRGRLKVYIGFAAGVGKSYRMLEEARALRLRGADVVLGRVESHGREDVLSLAEGLEQVALRQVEYRGLRVAEMDVDAVLRRRPHVVMIDDVAHSNAPGSSNKKRYQDALQILEAGVNVVCSFNIQHLESLKDVVERVTGVSVRETIPDSFLREADQVVNIDLATEDLLERLRAGKIVAADRIELALQNFFRPETLATLRELALREVAESLNRAAPHAQGGDGRPRRPPPRGDRLMVCVSLLSPRARALIGRGSRLAGRLNTDWVVAYVENPDEAVHRIDAGERRRLASAIDVARELGASVVQLQGRDPVPALLEYARTSGIGHIMVGRSERSSWGPRLGRSLASRIVRRAPNFDLHLVSLGRGEGDR